LVSVQLWLFMWAPLNGYSLDVSLGYFLLPLTMVLTGRLAYGERLSYLQKIAVFFACLGVINEVYQVGGFSWATLLVCIGYPTYFVVRKRLATDNLGGLWLDMTLTLPVAFWFVQSGEQGFNVFDQHPWLSLLIPLLGVISASALVVYIIASRLLPFSLFGLLSYVEPVLLRRRVAAGGKHQGRRMADLYPDLAGGAGAGVRRVQAFDATAQALTLPRTQCGSGLPAKAVCQSTLTLNAQPLSRASSLPQVYRRYGLVGGQHTTTHLVALDGFEQRLEVALAKTIVAFALDEFEEHRPHQGFREDLQQQRLSPDSDEPSSRMPRACSSSTGSPWFGRRPSSIS
jgi:hypothetical protein